MDHPLGHVGGGGWVIPIFAVKARQPGPGTRPSLPYPQKPPKDRAGRVRLQSTRSRERGRGSAGGQSAAVGRRAKR